MRVILELLRIIIIVVLLWGFSGYLIRKIYSEIDINIDKHGWIAMLGIYILIFVLYRNKMQFSGWYKGQGREKLPRGATQLLLSGSILLILLPAFLSLLN
ncbi:hypothetical protein Back11_56190 [Paenibacillus baekrokdamisoli]|uniref:Uncharacterized protein n=1 Tax=Paenibacillus baekrokdamisoli TaxID=1712516 RepID=A0A3G9JN34_9BACL|nr:hypothetical protein [Paenibacillus baekrokdamisoli]MBB3073500.1 hypothetical protein [Paenibacillus baekrokdamisoli]BBH24274.1 hypothetical protein Back11_56190 [Paenibacillus baekrokdamisoli]